MKIEGSNKITISKSEWLHIGEQAGWTKEAKKAKSPKQHGFIDQCIEKNKDKEDPGAYCASIVDKVKGTTDWRKEAGVKTAWDHKTRGQGRWDAINERRDDRYNKTNEDRDKAISIARNNLKEYISNLPPEGLELWNKPGGFNYVEFYDLFEKMKNDGRITEESFKEVESRLNRLIWARNLTSWEYADERGWRSKDLGIESFPRAKPIERPVEAPRPKAAVPDKDSLLETLDKMWTKDKTSPEYESLKSRIEAGEYKSIPHLVNSIKKRL